MKVRALHQPDWTLLVFSEVRRLKRRLAELKDRGFVTVYFGSAPDVNATDGRSSKERQIAVKEMREILRKRKLPDNLGDLFREFRDFFRDSPESLRPGADAPMSAYKVMVIDGATRLQTILEQLAVLTVQLDLADQSVIGFLRLRQPNEDVFFSIITRWCDPDRPGSYGGFIGPYRRAAFRKTREQEAIPLDAKGNEDLFSPEGMAARARGGKPLKVPSPMSSHLMGLTVWQAARAAGVPERTIRRWIAGNKVRASKDRRGVMRIPRDEVTRLASERNDQLVWKNCLRIRSKMSSTAAARRWVELRRKRGGKSREVRKQLLASAKAGSGD